MNLDRALASTLLLLLATNVALPTAVALGDESLGDGSLGNESVSADAVSSTPEVEYGYSDPEGQTYYPESPSVESTSGAIGESDSDSSDGSQLALTEQGEVSKTGSNSKLEIEHGYAIPMSIPMGSAPIDGLPAAITEALASVSPIWVLAGAAVVNLNASLKQNLGERELSISDYKAMADFVAPMEGVLTERREDMTLETGLLPTDTGLVTGLRSKDDAALRSALGLESAANTRSEAPLATAATQPDLTTDSNRVTSEALAASGVRVTAAKSPDQYIDDLSPEAFQKVLETMRDREAKGKRDDVYGPAIRARVAKEAKAAARAAKSKPSGPSPSGGPSRPKRSDSKGTEEEPGYANKYDDIGQLISERPPADIVDKMAKSAVVVGTPRPLTRGTNYTDGEQYFPHVQIFKESMRGKRWTPEEIATKLVVRPNGSVRTPAEQNQLLLVLQSKMQLRSSLEAETIAADPARDSWASALQAVSDLVDQRMPARRGKTPSSSGAASTLGVFWLADQWRGSDVTTTSPSLDDGAAFVNPPLQEGPLSVGFPESPTGIPFSEE